MNGTGFKDGSTELVVAGNRGFAGPRIAFLAHRDDRLEWVADYNLADAQRIAETILAEVAQWKETARG